MGLKSKDSPSAREIRAMPAMASTKPTKKAAPGREVRRHSHSSRAVNMGAEETMRPTVEAMENMRA